MSEKDYVIVVDGCENRARILKKYLDNYKDGLESLKEIVIKHGLSSELLKPLEIVEIADDVPTDTETLQPPKTAYVTVVDNAGFKARIASMGIEYYKRQERVFRAVAEQSGFSQKQLALYEIAEIIEE